jgi:hypothetical protein
VCARTETDAAEGVVLESARPDLEMLGRVFVCAGLFGCDAMVAAPPKLLHEEEYVDDLQERTNTHTNTHKQTNTCAAGGSNRKPTRLRHLARALRAEGGRSPSCPRDALLLPSHDWNGRVVWL